MRYLYGGDVENRTGLVPLLTPGRSYRVSTTAPADLADPDSAGVTLTADLTDPAGTALGGVQLVDAQSQYAFRGPDMGTPPQPLWASVNRGPWTQLAAIDGPQAIAAGAVQAAADAHAAADGVGAAQSLLRARLRRLSRATVPGIRQGSAQPVMASPPVVGAVVTASTIPTGVLYSPLVNPFGGGSAIRPDAFRYLGSAKMAQEATSFAVINAPAITDPSAGPGNIRAEFGTDADTLEVCFQATTGRLRVLVDGEVAVPTFTTGNTGSFSRLPITFPDRRPRTILVETSLVRFGGVQIPATATAWQTDYRGPRMVVAGDSYTAGQGADPAAPTRPDYGLSFARCLGDALGWPDTFASGLGGTGYLNPGTGGRVKLSARLQNDVVALAPDVVVVAMGHNDVGFAQAALAAEVAATWTALRSGLPSALLICTGPLFQGLAGSDLVNAQAAQSTILTAAAPYADALIDTLSTPWLTGTGRAGATTGSGNSDLYVCSDGTHPTAAGHAYLGQRMASALRPMLNGVI